MMVATPARVPAPPRATLQFWATPLLQQAARELAKLRTIGHNHTRSTQENAGNNERKDYEGLLPEMVIMLELERSGMQPKGYVLVADRPPVGPDFTIASVRYDIKSVPYGKEFLCVNERQRLDPRHAVDLILPLVFRSEDQIAVYKPIPVSVVATWPLREKHSQYRSCSIHDLQPIRSLLEVLP